MKTFLFITIVLLDSFAGYTQDLRSMLQESANTATQLKQVNANLDDARERGTALAAQIKEHNAKGCTYPEGHPEYCKGFNDEADELDRKAAIILKYLDKYESQQREIRSKLSLQLAKIRMYKILDGCNCSSGSLEDQFHCLERCYDGRR